MIAALPVPLHLPSDERCGASTQAPYSVLQLRQQLPHISTLHMIGVLKVPLPTRNYDQIGAAAADSKR